MSETADADFLLALAKGFVLTQQKVTRQECTNLGGKTIGNTCVLEKGN